MHGKEPEVLIEDCPPVKARWARDNDTAVSLRKVRRGFSYNWELCGLVGGKDFLLFRVFGKVHQQKNQLALKFVS